MGNGNSRGVTLIELLVVLALIALVSGIVGPPIARRFDTIALQTTGTEFAAELRKAQAVARATQVPVAMTYEDHEFQFWKESKEVASFKLPTSISPVSSDVGAYVFLPTGQIIGGGSLELQNQRGRKLTIKTDLLSSITVSSGL